MAAAMSGPRKYRSAFIRLLLSITLIGDLCIAAKKVEVPLFQDNCRNHSLGDDDTAYIYHRHSLHGFVDCKFVVQTGGDRYFEYYINEANILMCGASVSIFDGLSRWFNLIKFDCNTKIMLPLYGRTRSNKLTFYVRSSMIDHADIVFNMTVVNNIALPRLVNWTEPLKKEYDICNPDTVVHNPPMVYLPKPGYSTELYVKLEEVKTILPKCVFVVKTCAQCQVRVEVLDPKFDFNHCLSGDGRFAHRESSGCPFFAFYDGDYKDQTMRSIKASQDLGDYSSESRHLFIETSRSFGALYPMKNYGRPSAKFRVYSQLKSQTISRTNLVSTFELTSPFFPEPYIKNGETYTFVIENAWDDYFFITFDDWFLPHDAELRLPGLGVSRNGSETRRCFYSHQIREKMTFYPGIYDTPGPYYAYLGFKATVHFNNGSMNIPITDCDQAVDDNGGILQMGPELGNGKVRDCIWLVKIPVDADGVLLTVTHLEIKDPWLHLEVREGMLSSGPLKYQLNHTTNDSVLLSTAENGFYIRIRGRIFAEGNLIFHYAAFVKGCDQYSKDLFQCDNDHCINTTFRCDGVNHCEDHSDEGELLCKASDKDTQSGGNFVIPLVLSLVVIIIIVCVFLIILVRCYRQRLQRSPARYEDPPSLSSSRGTTSPLTTTSHLESLGKDENDPTSI